MKLKKILSTSSLILISSAVYAQYDTIVMCRACPAGYSGNGGGTSCDACGKGTYQNESGKSSCKSVDPGYCSTGSANTSQTKCTSDIVLSCNPQTCAATSCKDGYYLNGTTCTICPAGYACSKNSKTPCGPGYYQPSGGQSSCIPVGDGYCSTGSANSARTYCTHDTVPLEDCSILPTAKKIACSLRNADTIFNSGFRGVTACNSTSCAATSCSAGYGLSNGKCSACTGKYYSAGGTASCSLCADYYYETCTVTYTCNGSCKRYNYTEPQCIGGYETRTDGQCGNASGSTNGSCTYCKEWSPRQQGSCAEYEQTTCTDPTPGHREVYQEVNSNHTECVDTNRRGTCINNK